MTLFRRYAPALLHRIPFGIRGRNRINRNRSQPAIQAEATLQVGDLAPQGNALTQRIQNACIHRNARLPPEKRHDRFSLRQVLFQKVLNVSSVEMREPMQLQARHPAATLFHLGNGRTGKLEVVGHLFLSHLARFTRRPKSAGKLALGNSHGILNSIT